MDAAATPVSLLIACLASGTVVPVPEDVALLVAGHAVAQGHLGYAAAFGAGFAGTLARDGLAYAAGRAVAPHLESRWLRRVAGSRRVARARALLARHGDRMVFATRFAVGLRAPLYFASGLMGFPVARFVVLDLVGLLLTVPLALWLGGWAGPPAAEAVRAALSHQRLLVGGLAIAGLSWLYVRRRRERLARVAEAAVSAEQPPS
jgi:membrane protein DedA with SNARE-associated domain